MGDRWGGEREEGIGLPARRGYRRNAAGAPSAGDGADKVAAAAARVSADQPPPADKTARPRARRPAMDGQGQRGVRALQALLGLLSGPDAALPADEAALRRRLAQLPSDQVQRLADLLTAAKSGRGAPDRRLVQQLDAQLAERGLHVDIRGDHNSVNVTVAPPAQPPARNWEPGSRQRDKAGSYGRANWGRTLSRVKGFIDGR